MVCSSMRMVCLSMSAHGFLQLWGPMDNNVSYHGLPSLAVMLGVLQQNLLKRTATATAFFDFKPHESVRGDFLGPVRGETFFRHL